MNMSAGDLLIGRNATTTGSHYIGGGLTVMGNYLLTGGTNMNAATITDTLALGGYQQFTETGDNYIYFDNAQTNYLKWNDTGDQFEFANGLIFTNATATDSFYASNIFITNGGNFNAVTTTDTAYIGGKLQVAGAPTSTIASSLAIDTNTLVVNANEARVGIVTLHPQQALDVTGNAQVSGRLAVGTTDNSLYALNVLGNSYLNGSATTTQYLVLGTGAAANLNYANGDLLVSDDAEIADELFVLGRARITALNATSTLSDQATTTDTLNIGRTLSVATTTSSDFAFQVGTKPSIFGDGVSILCYATTSDIYNLGRATTTGQSYFGNTLRIAGVSQIFTGAASIITEANDLTIDAANNLVLQDATDLNNYLDLDISSASALTVGDGSANTLVVDTASDLVSIAGRLTVSQSATTTDYLFVGAGAPSYLSYTGGDLFVSDQLEVGGAATTTGSHYIGGDFNVAGKYFIPGGLKNK